MFELIQPTLKDILKEAESGKLQLPDFQRGWVWEENGVASLIASIARSFPVGALLTLKTGGAIHFQPRMVEGAEPVSREPDELLLDGQQRVTSLFQALLRDAPVDTRTSKGKKRQVYFYIDMKRALEDPFPDEAIEIVDHTRVVRQNIGRDVLLDLSEREGEYSEMRFPANHVFHATDWFNGWMAHWDYDREKIELFQRFDKMVLEPIRNYMMPMIRLSQDTTKEGVCLVFEKVNTGGKKLDAFELLTAMFAAAGTVNLRTDWYGDKTAKDPALRTGRERRLHEIDVLRGIDRADFLRAISLVHTHELRRAAEDGGRSGKELPSVSCTHAALLDIPAEAYAKWCDAVSKGFESAARFLHGRGLFWWKDVPYPSQITALAALFALRENRALTAGEAKKLERWFWCGVFGELYGSSTDTRIANDVEDLRRWLDGGESEPRTINGAIFSESRLDTLYMRLSAAYKGVHALLMNSGARDFLSGEQIGVANFFSESFDIHHIFPRAWCDAHKIPRERYNTIVNKSAISARTNRKIGGKAPSAYCEKLDADTSAAGVELDEILLSHQIDPSLLREDDFDNFYTARKTALLGMIEGAMGKSALRDGTGDASDYDMPDEDDLAAA